MIKKKTQEEWKLFALGSYAFESESNIRYNWATLVCKGKNQVINISLI